MQKQPSPYDAVYGGQPVFPHDGVVLGGLEGIRQQLNAPDEAVRVAALKKALGYGESGLDLVIEVLRDNPQGLGWDAYEVLVLRPEAKAKEALNRYPVRLCDLLRSGKWRDADDETYAMMICAVGKNFGQWFTSDELLNFPGTDLRTIDRLWVNYSQGKFGFSVQQAIYVECGAKLDGQYPGDTTWREFCNRVGWIRGDSYLCYGDLKANPPLSPAGELPFGAGGVGVWLRGVTMGSVFSSLLSHRDL